MTSLYFLANSLNYLVAGTGNRSEITLGYYTSTATAASTCCRSAVCSRAKCARSARELGVPERVIDKPPTAGLWVGQTDEAEMGSPTTPSRNTSPRVRKRCRPTSLSGSSDCEGVRPQARDAAHRAHRITLHYNARVSLIFGGIHAPFDHPPGSVARSPPACLPPSSRLRPPNPTSSSGCGRPSYDEGMGPGEPRKTASPLPSSRPARSTKRRTRSASAP